MSKYDATMLSVSLHCGAHIPLATEVSRWLTSSLKTIFMRAQMGGAKGVAAAERASITLACANGMKMVCRQRVAA